MIASGLFCVRTYGRENIAKFGPLENGLATR